MAHAMELPVECADSKGPSGADFSRWRLLVPYRAPRGQKRVQRDGWETNIAEPVGWAFGLGNAGQTYVFEKDGTLYESRVSYYQAIDGLDLTIGAANLKPANILEAAGRPLGRESDSRCFGCHATNAVNHGSIDLEGLIPGVQCERCHGETESHLKAMKAGTAQTSGMKSLRTMSAEDTSNFCGQCHRTWDEIASSGVLGIANVRFQPYRLTSSRCYDSEDRRIACTACHDPHVEVNRASVSYDSRCQACHAGAKACSQTLQSS